MKNIQAVIATNGRAGGNAISRLLHWHSQKRENPRISAKGFIRDWSEKSVCMLYGENAAGNAMVFFQLSGLSEKYFGKDRNAAEINGLMKKAKLKTVATGMLALASAAGMLLTTPYIHLFTPLMLTTIALCGIGAKFHSDLLDLKKEWNGFEATVFASEASLWGGIEAQDFGFLSWAAARFDFAKILGQKERMN